MITENERKYLYFNHLNGCLTKQITSDMSSFNTTIEWKGFNHSLLSKHIEKLFFLFLGTCRGIILYKEMHKQMIWAIFDWLVYFMYNIEYWLVYLCL